MTPDLTWPLLSLFGLGVFHGLNPAMGWLFAVALGMQERRRSAVLSALLPLALGHALAVLVAVAAALLVGSVLPPDVLKWAVAAMLLAMGGYRLVRHAHPRFGGMRASGRDLVVWSFLMASAHGAGLMVLPFVVDDAAPAASTGVHEHHDHEMPASSMQPAGLQGRGEHSTHGAALAEALPRQRSVGLLVTAVHTAGYLSVMALLAVVVYERVGLRLLRTHWVNLDLLWSGALMATAVLTLFL
jgi:hypothetical protein